MNEKSFINGAGAPTSSWMPVSSLEDLREAVAELGLPAVLKTTRLGYDGRGQAVLREPADLEPALARLAPAPFILESFIDFACEISVIVARGQDGTVRAFDPVENRHRNHILDLTLAPAQVTPEIAASARGHCHRPGRLPRSGGAAGRGDVRGSRWRAADQRAGAAAA